MAAQRPREKHRRGDPPPGRRRAEGQHTEKAGGDPLQRAGETGTRAAQAAGAAADREREAQAEGQAAGAAARTFSRPERGGKGTVNRGGLVCGCGERGGTLIFRLKSSISFRWKMAEGLEMRYNKGRRARRTEKGGGAGD